MGYRHYMYKIPKKISSEVKKLNNKELIKRYCDKDDDYFSPFDIQEMTKIFEFGKLYWEDTAKKIYSHGKPMFKKEVMQEVEDFQPYIVTKEALLEVINIYQDKIKNMYKELLKYDNCENDTDKYESLEKHIKYYNYYWKNGFVLNLDKNTDNISNSWLYEHQIFELVRLYKTIDFKEFDLVFLGY